LLGMDDVARLEPHREPFGEIEFETEAARAGDAQVAGLDRRAAAEHDVEVEAPDRAAHPAHLAVGERPHEIAEKEVLRVVLRLDDADEALLALNQRVEQAVALARV